MWHCFIKLLKSILIRLSCHSDFVNIVLEHERSRHDVSVAMEIIIPLHFFHLHNSVSFLPYIMLYEHFFCFDTSICCSEVRLYGKIEILFSKPGNFNGLYLVSNQTTAKIRLFSWKYCYELVFLVRYSLVSSHPGLKRLLNISPWTPFLLRFQEMDP